MKSQSVVIFNCYCLFIVSIMGGKLHFPEDEDQPPLGQKCLKITDCPLFAGLLNSSTRSDPKHLIRLIKEKQCGFDGNIPLVFCNIVKTSRNIVPSATTSSEIYESSDNNSPNSGYLTSHPNYRLLPTNICGPVATSSASRITSAAKATLNEYPWMALIAYNVGGEVDFRCGGTVINERYVLTAAHCIVDFTVIGVRLGEFNLATSKDCNQKTGHCASPTQDFFAEKFIVHPDYNSRTLTNDIALILLATAADFSYDNVKPICLPIDNVNLSGKFATVSGWGVTENGFKSPELLKVSLPVWPISKCQRVYDFASITSKQICAGAYKGRDSCGGDSGGPLTILNKFGDKTRFIQYGIVSYGPTFCGTEDKPGIYTSVYKYMTWILDNINSWDE